MHPARLSYLAYNNAQRRAVISKDERPDGTFVTLECGHSTSFVPHVDARNIKDCGCVECGKAYVKSAPQYAKEFLEG